jgi:hypothetical protein
MIPDKRKPRPGGDGRGFQKIIALDSGDRSELRPSAHRDQAVSRRRDDFARAAVFHEFGYRAGRALDYDGFVNRQPNRLSSAWRAGP